MSSDAMQTATATSSPPPKSPSPATTPTPTPQASAPTSTVTIGGKAMRARPAPTAVPLVKKKIRRRCYTCPGCISSPCGTCSQCVSTAKKRSTCKLQACWKLNHNLEGGVGSDGFVDYCIKCGPEYESPSEGEEGGGEEEGEEENKVQVVGADSEVLGNAMVCCGTCPRAWHCRCIYSPVRPSADGDVRKDVYVIPLGEEEEYKCKVCIEGEAEAERKMEEEEKRQSERKVGGKKRSGERAFGAPHPIMAKKVQGKLFQKNTLVTLPKPSTMTDLEAIMRDPDFLQACQFLHLAEKELKMKFKGDINGPECFPIKDLEVAMAVVEDGVLPDSCDDFFDGLSQDNLIRGRTKLSEVVAKLLMSSSQRHAAGKDYEAPSMDAWSGAVKSRLLLWAGIVETGKGELKIRHVLEAQEELLEASAASKSREPVNGEALLRKIVKTNFNVAGGGKLFEELVKELQKDVPEISDRLEEAKSVFKSNQTKAMKEVIYGILEGDVDGTSQGEDDDAMLMAEMAAEEAEEAEEAAEAAVAGGGDEELLGRVSPTDTISMDDGEDLRGPILELASGLPSSVLGDDALFCLSSRDMKTLFKVVTEEFSACEEIGDLENFLAPYEFCVGLFEEDFYERLKTETVFSFKSMVPRQRVLVLRALCDMLLMTDKKVQADIKTHFNSTLRITPFAYDSFGRGYYWTEGLQSLLSCRIYRTLSTEDHDTSRVTSFKLSVPSGKAFDMHESWEVVVDGQDDLEKLLKQKDLFVTSKKGKGSELKTELEGILEDLVIERERYEDKARLQNKKAALAALPRRQSSRTRAGEGVSSYGEFEHYDESQYGPDVL